MQKKWIVLMVIIIAIVIMVTSIGYAVYLIIVVETEKSDQSYEYQVEIIPEDAGDYTLFIPLIINAERSVSELMENLYLTNGNATHEILETEHGTALKINGNEDVYLTASSANPILWPYLSMLNDTEEDRMHVYGDVEFWVYCNKTIGVGNITLNIHLTADVSSTLYDGLGRHKWSSGTHKEEEIENATVTSGWQKVQGYISVEVLN